MGQILVKNAVERKPGYLYYRFLTAMFKPVQWMVKVTCVPLKWHAVEKRRKNLLQRKLQKEDVKSSFFLFSFS